MPQCKCHYLFVPPLVLNQQAEHGLDLCDLSLLIPLANQAGSGVYFTPSILLTIKLLKYDYISVDLTIGFFNPTIKLLATIYPPLFTISKIELRDVSCSTRMIHFIQSVEILFCPPHPGLVHQTAAEQQVHGTRRDENIPPSQIFIPYDQGLDSPALVVGVDATLL